MLSAAERVIMGRCVHGAFVSESDLTALQIKTARQLVDRGLLEGAGTEADGRKVYRATSAGKSSYKDWS